MFTKRISFVRNNFYQELEKYLPNAQKFRVVQVFSKKKQRKNSAGFSQIKKKWIVENQRKTKFQGSNCVMKKHSWAIK